MFSGLWPIYKREVRTFFRSASTYIILGLLFLIVGAIYHTVMFEFVNDSAMAAAGGPFNAPTEAPNITTAVIENIFNVLSVMILFTMPILSMGLIASERSTGTFEVLVTCPTSDWGILLGKYFALVTVGALIVALSSVYPAATFFLGRAQGALPELPVVIACTIGLFLIFATYAAFGLMASSFTRSQMTASILTLVGLLLWNSLAEFQIGDHAVQQVLNELSAARHTQNFTAGLLSVSDFAFYLLASFVFLFVAARMLEARRWRV